MEASWGWRVLRMVLVGVGAGALFMLLEPHGYGWLILPLAIVGTLAVAVWRFLRLRRERGSVSEVERWTEALADASRRPGVLKQVRDLRREYAPWGETRNAHAEMTVVLAELLEADGEPAEARKVLDEVNVGALEPDTAGIVRLARAGIRLRQGDAEAALEELRGGMGDTEDAQLELRLRLLEASARLELGEAEDALATATRARREAGGDEELIVEARVVRAAALDALGRHEEALQVVQSFGRPTVGMLRWRGQPRVRELAYEALRTEDEA